jgi:di/tricarboxylate transporter
MVAVDPSLMMWLTFAVIVIAVVSYATEYFTLEFTSLGVIAVLLVLFEFFPVATASGPISSSRLLAGFADPALITVVCMLVIGQGLVHTGALQRIARDILFLARGSGSIAIALTLLLAMALSAFTNNTPIVVVFIPVLQALAERDRLSSSKVMIPLSYAAILGGMTTLIGSSTNLLVSGAMLDMGEAPLSMFSFTVPALFVALIGLLYVVLVAPRLLPARTTMAGALVGSAGRQYLAQITVGPNSNLVGHAAAAGMFPALKDLSVQILQRGEHAELAPFEDIVLRSGDTLVVAGTRKALTELLARDSGLIGDVDREEPETESPAVPRKPGDEQVLVEVMIAPASRMVGQNLEQIGLRRRFGCIVLGLQRRSRMIRQRVTEIRLEAGDVLLMRGRREDIEGLRANPDVLLMEWSTAELPALHLARRAIVISLLVIAAISFELLPVVIAAVCGAAAMLASSCLNIRQASRAVDSKVVMLVAAALAMGVAMQATGGAAWLAHLVIAATGGDDPAIVLSAFFLVVALVTNVLSNNAAAVLFTPIGINLAHSIGVDPMAFAVAVVIAASCSFATPIGYQTNLLVMAPGHYRFSDFFRAGVPLVLIVWLAFSFFAPIYFGL